MGFRENLKSQLEYAGMLVKELSARSGVKKKTIDSYLGTRCYTPSADAAVSIAKALGTTVEYLVTGSETAGIGNSAHFSPEIRHMARIAEKLKPDYRKIALSFIETLKKHEDSQVNTPETRA